MRGLADCIAGLVGVVGELWVLCAAVVGWARGWYDAACCVTLVHCITQLACGLL